MVGNGWLDGITTKALTNPHFPLQAIKESEERERERERERENGMIIWQPA
jgi:hypothetical protein